jgi:nicotinamide-nucleotide amidase
MTKNNEKQAYIPAGSIPVENPNGTAPAFIVEGAPGVIVSLPGVPFEMKRLFDHRVIPYLREKFDLREMIVSRILKIAEIGVDDRIGHLIRHSTNPTVGVLAHPGQVDVRISVKMAVAHATGLRGRKYNFAGRGNPDLTRITMHALNLVRRTIEGTV